MSFAVLAVVSVVILATGWLGNRLGREYALDAASNVIQFNAAAVCGNIHEMMMSRSGAGVPEFIAEISRRGESCQDISLVSHPSGRISFSKLQEVGAILDKDNQSCRLCHVNSDMSIASQEPRDVLKTGLDGGRVMQVMTPIINQNSCRTADCHVHGESGVVLGYLMTDYSLASFDERMMGLKPLLALAAIVAVLLVIGTLLILFRWFLAKPLRRLIAGVDTLAAGDLGFRFPARRSDEIGLVEDSFNDLAAQIQSHQIELSRAFEYLEGIVEHTADIVVTVNNRGFIQTFNRGAERALGYGRHEIIGKRIEMMFDDPQERDEAIARLQEQENVPNWATRLKTKDGQIRHVLLSLSRLRNRSGEVIGTLGISKDVTKEKDLQQKLIQSEQAAAIGRAITAIQHAVKNMLNTLRGGLYVVKVGHKKGQEERIVEGCEMIEEGLDRISDLSLNMLKYAREWKIEPEPVDLAEMVGKIVVAVNQTAKERGVTLRTDVDDSLPAVPCDPRLIHMCLMDLVSNALDACELRDYDEDEAPEIVIRAYRTEDGNGVVVEVQDNGAGMTQEVIDNVFTPFFSTKQKWGTGLGLALTARVIDLHNGRIAVESEPEKGALFRVTLPLDGQGENEGATR